MQYLIGLAMYLDRGISYLFGKSNAERRANLFMLLTIWIVISALGFALSGCSTFGGREFAAVKAIATDGVHGAISDRKEFNDLKTETLLVLPCDASLGSVMRIPNERQRAILIELCGGPAANPTVIFSGIPPVVVPGSQPAPTLAPP